MGQRETDEENECVCAQKQQQQLQQLSWWLVALEITLIHVLGGLSLFELVFPFISRHWRNGLSLFNKRQSGADVISHLPLAVNKDLLLTVFCSGATLASTSWCPRQLYDQSEQREYVFSPNLIKNYWLSSLLQVWKWRLCSSKLFSLLWPELPGIRPIFTFSSSTKTCNNSNRSRLPNKHSSEGLPKCINPTDDNKSWAKCCIQIVTFVCGGIWFCNTCDFTCVLWWHPQSFEHFCWKGTNASDAQTQTLRLQGEEYEQCCVKRSVSAKGSLYPRIKQVNLSRSCNPEAPRKFDSPRTQC